MKYFLLIVFIPILFSCKKTNLSNEVGLPVEQVALEKLDTSENKIYIRIIKDEKYFINNNELPLDFIQDELASLLKGKTGTVVITIDKDAPNQYLIKIAKITSSLKAKTVISVKPE